MPMAAYSGPDSDLKPNADDISAFITWWFSHTTQGKIEIGWLDPNGLGLIHFSQFDKDDINALVITAFQENLIPGQSMYVRASTVNPRAVFSRKEGYTTDQDAVQTPGIWSDIDTPEQFAQARSVQTLLQPNGAVITGMTPHMRVQNWFRVSEPIVNPPLVTSLNKRLYALYGGDPAVVNPTRLMRLPGTVAWPWKKGRIPELTYLRMPSESNPRQASYPISLLTSQLPAEESVSPTPSVTSIGIRGFPDTVSKYVESIRSGASWHDALIRLIAHWIGRGWGDEEIILAVESLPQAAWRGKIDWTEVRNAIEGGRRKWGVLSVDHVISTSPDSPFAQHIIDPWDTLEPPVFPIHSLPGILRGYTEARARVMGADPCGLAWSALSAASAAIHGKTRLRMKRHDTWSVPPALWTLLVGPPSSKKSPILTDAWMPLRQLQGVALRVYADAMAQWNSLPKDEKAATPQPKRPIRLLTNDATMESVQELLSLQDRGIGVLRDELSGFIGSFEKYNGAGKGGSADRAFWLESHNGGPHTVDRIGRGTVSLENLLTTVTGGIQPEVLESFAGHSNDGLLQRFMMFIIRAATLGTDEPSGPIVADYTARIQGLVDISPASQAVFSDAAHEVREDVERELFALEQGDALGSKFSAFVGKLPGMYGRLCLVLSYLEPTGLGYIVNERTAMMARSLIRNSVVPHAAKIYTTIGSPGVSSSLEGMQGIAGYILSKKLERIVMSDMTSNVRQCRKLSVYEVLRMVSPLVSGGWLNPEQETPTNRAWLVNPAVHMTFADRAATERVRRQTAFSLLTGLSGEEND